MASVVEIGNLALSLIGEPPVVNLEVDNKAARLINRLYEPVRDSVLRGHPWNSAIWRASLPELETGPVWGDELAYQLPADFLRLLSLQDQTIAWRKEGLLIMTTASAPLNILYIRKIEDANLFDPLLIDAIASRMAAELAFPLTQNPRLVTAMWQLYARKLTEARGVDGQESVGDTAYATHYINARQIGTW